MKYIFPKFTLSTAIIIVFGIFAIIQIYSTDREYYEMGIYEIANINQTQKINLNIQEIDYIKITIEENYKDTRYENCTLDNIHFIGNLRAATRLQVRLRVEDVKTSKNSITEKKAEEIEPTRNYSQAPIAWKTIDTKCKGEYLIIYFEEKIDLDFIQIDKLITNNNFVSSLPRLISITVGR